MGKLLKIIKVRLQIENRPKGYPCGINPKSPIVNLESFGYDDNSVGIVGVRPTGHQGNPFIRG
jgi:hypothetical protein